MRADSINDIGVLRQKTKILERENERLSRRVSELLGELMQLKGMSAAAIELNLPGLVEQTKGKPSSTTSSPKSERRPHNEDGEPAKQKAPGHGPTPQPELKIKDEQFRVPEADKSCGGCGKTMTPWAGKEDVVDVVDRIPAQWIIRRCTLEKCRCPEGCSIVTAEGPRKLIPGGRYTMDVALMSCIDKFLFHTPIERQVRQASLVGMRITSQTLWDQQWALAQLLVPLVGKIKAHILSRDWLGADLTPFLHIKKGGASKRQVWQIACPEARHFQMMDSKSVTDGELVFTVKKGEDIELCLRGVAMVDGAAELTAVAKSLGFKLANCWSHARRNVLAANSEAPGQVAQFLDIVAKLYALERRLAGAEEGAPLGGYRKALDLEALRRARATEGRAIVNELKRWMLAQSCIPGGKLKAGLAYVAARWTDLTKFLDDPRIPLDNNVSEAGFVGLAQGRRNYVGCRTERGMRVATAFYTVVESARVAGAHVEKYLRYATTTLLGHGDPLLPHAWVAANAAAADTS